MCPGLTEEQAREKAEQMMYQDGYIPSNSKDVRIASLLVQSKYLTEIGHIMFDNIDLSSVSSEELSSVLSVVRGSVTLYNVKLSPRHTGTVFRSMTTISWGIYLYKNTEIDVKTASDTIKEIKDRISCPFIVCWYNSVDKYRGVMQDWANMLGWKYQKDSDWIEIIKS